MTLFELLEQVDNKYATLENLQDIVACFNEAPDLAAPIDEYFKG